MARKDLLKGLMADELPGEAAAQVSQVDPARPRHYIGAVGAVSQSIAQLRSRSVLEIDTALIEAGGLRDRMDYEDESHAELVASLRDHGQQVPILVRPHPEAEGRYQIVYGRRRVLALRELGIPAKALVRDLDDCALVIAQGQENSARKDLTFIEKCNFAHQLRTAGYDRKTICDALSVDKTLISRMLSVFDRVGVDVIEAIGAAPGVGRDRWVQLADRIADNGIESVEIAGLVNLTASQENSPRRFEVAFEMAAGAAPRTAPAASLATGGTARAQRITDSAGAEIARVTRRPDQIVLTLGDAGEGSFADWLVGRLEEIHNEWQSAGRE